ncbi:hypothetical protein [Mesorhizobium sp. M7A.F.Ca.CA.004.12.1.1]|uniref:hypothetical protein n=1 Tax=Mesorhizobium sp. M7A.F.Ca.CA.004.12.1.1 TaxID=2496732 RepID=UPI001FE026D9|nr:hypothetical protein [Mesorhizobium sp. M7A.F.Ca.CA.004.12.1.1]
MVAPVSKGMSWMLASRYRAIACSVRANSSQPSRNLASSALATSVSPETVFSPGVFIFIGRNVPWQTYLEQTGKGHPRKRSSFPVHDATLARENTL